MNDQIIQLIEKINVMSHHNDPLLSCIRYPQMLTSSLNQLLDIVQMDNIKQSIIDMIKYIITEKARQQFMGSHIKYNDMFHAIISGSPGTGKTTIGKILARIWMALGVLESPQTKPQDPTPIIANLYSQRTDALEKEVIFHQTKTNLLHNIIKECQESTISLRQELLSTDNSNLLSHIRTIRDKLDECLSFLSSSNVEQKLDNEPKFVIATRSDLVAEYAGQTAPKTRKVLDSARGGVLFIDEAYSLCNTDNVSSDKFGEECLVVINEYMTNYPGEIIIIFAGYKEKLQQTIFRVQPGLERRCTFNFDIQNYDISSLAAIFIKHIEKNGWILQTNTNLLSIFTQYKDIITGQGGFVEKLFIHCKFSYSRSKFDDVFSTSFVPCYDNLITSDILIDAFESISKHSLLTSFSHSYYTMYV